MTNSAFKDRDVETSTHEEEAPLDPAVLRVQTRLRRLMAGSTLIMFAGFAALFAVIVYKVNSVGKENSGVALPETVKLGAGAEVLGLSQGADGRLILLVQQEGAFQLVHLDAASGEILGRTKLLAE